MRRAEHGVYELLRRVRGGESAFLLVALAWTNRLASRLAAFPSARPLDVGEPREEGVNDRNQHEREERREEETPDHRDPEGPARLGSGAKTDRDGKHAEDRREGGHEDRAEPDLRG